MGMILRIASSRIVGEGDIVGRKRVFLFKSSNSVMRGCVYARSTLKGLVADLRVIIKVNGNNASHFEEMGVGNGRNIEMLFLTYSKLRCISPIKTKSFLFILYCLQFAVTLHPQTTESRKFSN